MLRHRLLFGPILIVLLLAVAWADQFLQERTGRAALLLFPLMALVDILAARELTALFRARKITTSFRVNTLAVVLGLIASSLTVREAGPISGVAVVCTAAGIVYCTSLLFYSRGQNVDGVVSASAATLLVFTYIGLLGGFIVMLRKEYSAWLLIAVVLTIKSCDIGAFAFGKLFGRHKLIPWLSPGKTWEGLFGGVLFSGLVGAGMTVVLRSIPEQPAFTIWQGVLAGLIFGFLGQAGDLAASLLKRDAGVKDYSHTLPGFGGVLDVLDSPLLVVPVAYWLLKLTEIDATGKIVEAAKSSGWW
ncbi:MAG TPA: phosphatidate cytidylyltransferase [Phycisphaerales bacterium]|nr:phosphatidate cytidylyltransferase [Phycisphaerales bacterium]